jgi:solute:Na+ symporter, SSS family
VPRAVPAVYGPRPRHIADGAVYVFLSGLLSAIFNEVLQFVLFWLGALPISIVGLIEAGRWNGVVERVARNSPGQSYAHLWSTLGAFGDNPMGIQ